MSLCCLALSHRLPDARALSGFAHSFQTSLQTWDMPQKKQELIIVFNNPSETTTWSCSRQSCAVRCTNGAAAVCI